MSLRGPFVSLQNSISLGGTVSEEKLEIEVLPSGEIRMMYSDKSVKQVAEILGAKVVDVPRASNVEFERVTEIKNHRFPATEGWSVRAAHDPNLALRILSSFNLGVGERYIDSIIVSDNEHLAIALFTDREMAIKSEIEHFWELLPPGASCPVPKKES